MQSFDTLYIYKHHANTKGNHWENKLSVLTLPVRQKVNIFLTKVACKSENKCKNNVSNIDIRGT